VLIRSNVQTLIFIPWHGVFSRKQNLRLRRSMGQSFSVTSVSPKASQFIVILKCYTTVDLSSNKAKPLRQISSWSNSNM
jgi:hypothetical protein